MSKLTFCLVGCGGIGLWHISALTELPEAELVAVADTDEKRMGRIARKSRIQSTYTDYKTMFEEVRPDAAIIATPVYLHKQMTIDALASGIHVLCEKPISRNLDEAKEMVQASRDYGAYLSHMNNWRHSGIVQRIKELTDTGEAGSIHSLYMSFANPGSEHMMPFIGEWIFDKEKAGGGVVLDLGYHAVDIISYLFGEIKAVSSEVGTFVKEGDVEDIAFIVFRNQEDLPGILKLSWAEITPMEEAGTVIKLYGTKGSISSQLQNNMIQITTNKPRLATRSIDTDDLKELPGYAGHKAKIEEFIKRVHSGEDLFEEAEDILRTSAVLEAVYQSAENGMRVEVDRLLLELEDRNEYGA